MEEDWLRIARILLEHGADANTENNEGQTPLQILLSDSWRIDEGDFHDLVLSVLKHGAEVNRRDKDNKTPLLLIMEQNWINIARILLEHGADANVENVNGETPLHTLLSERWKWDEDDVLDPVLALLEHGAEVDRRNKDNETPLFLVMEYDWFKIGRILLEHGADANAENIDGETLLDTLLSESWKRNEDDVIDPVLLLLKHGAEVNRRNRYNKTPLLLVMEQGWFKIARILLKNGADANAENNIGQTPLHILLSGRRKKDEDEALDLVLVLLLKHGAEVNKQDQLKDTPLLLAMEQNWFKIAQILLEHGADANAENFFGKTPLSILSESRHYRQFYFLRNFVYDARSLLKHVVGVNRHDKDVKSLLLLGMGKRNYEFTQVVIDLDTDAILENDIDEISVKQVSRGHYDPRERGLSVLQQSLERTVDLNAQDKNQITPSYLQPNLGPFQMATLLFYHGANLDARKIAGESSLSQQIKGEH